MIESTSYVVSMLGSMILLILFIRIAYIEDEVRDDASFDLRDSQYDIENDPRLIKLNRVIKVLSFIVTFAFALFMFIYGARMIYNWFF